MGGKVGETINIILILANSRMSSCVRQAYGAKNYERLAALKDRFDPEEYFG